jgi:hypothetical protein
MRRVNLFLFNLLISVIALLTTIIIGFNVPYTTTTQEQHGMGGQMGGMGQFTTTIATSSATSGYFWTLVAALAAWVIISVAGLAYYLIYPQAKIGAVNPANFATPQIGASGAVNSVPAYESVEKTLTEDERKVINTLNLHGGKYLKNTSLKKPV